MPPEDRERLLHILDTADLIQSEIFEMTCDSFHAGSVRAWGIIKPLENIGEAAVQLTDATEARLPDVPWSQMYDMRNRLVHAYWGINCRIVWDTCTMAIGPLATTIRRYLGQ